MCKKGCLSCRFGQYKKTPSGRLKRGEPVKCTVQYVPSPDVIYNALKDIVPASMISHYTAIMPWTLGMWPQDGDDGADCPAWEEREEVQDV